MRSKDKRKAMHELEESVVRFRKTELPAYRRKHKYLPVIGEGSLDAALLFIGEAPGKKEAQTGKPFCGSAGRILSQLLQEIGLLRRDVYITNVVKDRPPDNRDPLPSEIDAYAPFLNEQIRIIEPKTIVTLGRFSMEYIMRIFDLEDRVQPISFAHGSVYDAIATHGPIRIVPQYHPAASIYNRKLTNILQNDFKILTKYI